MPKSESIYTVAGVSLILFTLSGLLSGCGLKTAFNGEKSATGSNTRPGDTGGGSSSSSSGGSTVDTPANYFSKKVLPLFQASCTGCHNDPRQGGLGGLTIYSYTQMHRQLMNGTTPDQNQLISKLRDQPSHQGGDVCSGDNNRSPCFEVKTWFAKELIAKGGTSSSAPLGQITVTTVRGQVQGWAVDIGAQASSVVVNFYIDGPKGTGTLIGSATANLTNPPSGFSGKHGFLYQIPSQYLNGSSRTLYTDAPSLSGGSSTALKESPYSFQLYTPKASNYYTSTLLPALTSSCQSCHTVGSSFLELDSAFYDHLISPLKQLGGSATNNYLHIKASGGMSHGGGNVCGGGSPCAQIAAWWARELGP